MIYAVCSMNFGFNLLVIIKSVPRFFSSLVWLQTESDSTWSYYQRALWKPLQATNGFMSFLQLMKAIHYISYSRLWFGEMQLLILLASSFWQAYLFYLTSQFDYS